MWFFMLIFSLLLSVLIFSLIFVWLICVFIFLEYLGLIFTIFIYELELEYFRVLVSNFLDFYLFNLVF